MYRTTPFVRLLFPLAAGIALSQWIAQPLSYGPRWLAIVGILLLAAAGWRYPFRFRWIFGVVLHLALAFAGYYHGIRYNELQRPDHFSHYPAAQWVLGVAYDAPSTGTRLKIPLRVEAVGIEPDALQPASGNLLLFVEETPGTEAVRYGDRLLVRALVRPAEAAKNPHAFDYRRYLHFQNIHYTAFVRPDSLHVQSSGHGYWCWQMAYACRDRFLSALQRHFPTSDTYAVAAALLVGYREDLSDELRAAYTETGSMHALAVSGAHVGTLYVGLLLLLHRLRWRGRYGHVLQMAVILVLIWAFTLLTGATASVLRASVMFSAFLIGKTLHRDASIWNILAASAFVLLTVNPYLLFDAGAQLSYAAVAGMVAFYPHLSARSPTLPKVLDMGWKVLLTGVAAQLGTLPLSLYYFHQFPVYFWLSGWVVLLGGAIFLWAGAALVLFDFCLPALAWGLGKVLYALVCGMNWLIVGIQHLPGALLDGIWLPAWGAVVLAGAVIFGGMALAQRRGRWVVAALTCMAVLSIGRARRGVDRLDQCVLTIYAVNQKSLADFFDGRQGITLTDTLTARQERFAAQNHRWSAGIRVEEALLLPTDTAFRHERFRYHPPFLDAGRRRLALIDRHHVASALVPMPVDALWLRGNPRMAVAEAVARYPTRLVVADASNSRRQTARWQSECAALGLAFHDVRTMGALTMRCD
jgi:competence protein ComEC